MGKARPGAPGLPVKLSLLSNCLGAIRNFEYDRDRREPQRGHFKRLSS
jgi:hypothetical protein